jgi:hypothetical protein
MVDLLEINKVVMNIVVSQRLLSNNVSADIHTQSQTADSNVIEVSAADNAGVAAATAATTISTTTTTTATTTIVVSELTDKIITSGKTTFSWINNYIQQQLPIIYVSDELQQNVTMQANMLDDIKSQVNIILNETEKIDMRFDILIKNHFHSVMPMLCTGYFDCHLYRSRIID